jgi:hypothetical protein
MSEVEELRRLGIRVVQIWERLGECENEFAPEHDPPACNEYRDLLDTAIHELSRSLADHALERMKAPKRCTECSLVLVGGERVTEDPIGSGEYRHADYQECENGPLPLGLADGGF